MHVPNHQPVLLFDQDATGVQLELWWPVTPFSPRLRWATARKAMEPWTEILDDPAGFKRPMTDVFLVRPVIPLLYPLVI